MGHVSDVIRARSVQKGGQRTTRFVPRMLTPWAPSMHIFLWYAPLWEPSGLAQTKVSFRKSWKKSVPRQCALGVMARPVEEAMISNGVD